MKWIVFYCMKKIWVDCCFGCWTLNLRLYLCYRIEYAKGMNSKDCKDFSVPSQPCFTGRINLYMFGFERVQNYFWIALSNVQSQSSLYLLLKTRDWSCTCLSVAYHYLKSICITIWRSLFLSLILNWLISSQVWTLGRTAWYLITR